MRAACFEANGDIKEGFATCTDKVYAEVVSAKEREKLAECLKPGSAAAERVLAANHENVKYLLINYSPIVFVNGSYYKGSYTNVEHLLETLCNSYEHPPAQCGELAVFEQAYDLNSSKLHAFLAICLVVCLGAALIAVSLFYILYKKKIKKTFNFTLNDKINEALAKYYTDEEKEGDGEDGQAINEGEDN